MTHAGTLYFYLDPTLGSHGNLDLLEESLGAKWNQWVLFVAVLPNDVDGSAAREHKVSKNIGQESQFGSTVGLFLW